MEKPLMAKVSFEWDEAKDALNRRKHGVSFLLAQQAFLDRRRIIARDLAHSGIERRYYCIGRVGQGVLTVRFTYRGGTVRIIGAGYWRKGKNLYEDENQIHG
jgi:uncharacterized DUF497 family protein